MNATELIELLKEEQGFFEEVSEIAEVVLYGSALSEAEPSDDVDLLVIPARELSESEKVDVRQKVWERFKDRVPVALDVQMPREGLTKGELSARGVRTASVFQK